MRCLSLLLLALAATAVRADEYVPAPAKAAHWAWQAPVRPPVPVPADKGWVRNPVDAFVLAQIEKAGLRPAAPATREQLIRRATFDLIGLPPTPAEIAAFTGDSTADAWEKVIERLLASPHYGERWGRHWLDLVRFAESNGYEMDETRLDAWRYRDYVIDAFNNDKPYDRFVQEQIAGDELFPDSTQARIATGFNLLGPDMTDAADQRQRRQNTLDDMTDTTGLVFLGMTIGCALSRPQIRAHPANGLLPLAGLFRSRPLPQGCFDCPARRNCQAPGSGKRISSVGPTNHQCHRENRAALPPEALRVSFSKTCRGGPGRAAARSSSTITRATGPSREDSTSVIGDRQRSNQCALKKRPGPGPAAQ